ncbi:uncharacterized protein LOC107042542 [Diachasma alloeum]|uniref:uncharacterized protein LOC107042542 n=1 Tax=Diachasma alloeum TaxID=454923 RepID=UPI00073826AF|nr:uncharacterized protein LOC107042542 [Diachasma alloeum]
MLLLFDFSKTFDSVCHVLLLRKLLGYGFSASSVRWLASYLAGRSQVTLGGASGCSSFCHLNRGVPQGSVLDLLLFFLFINDVGVNLGPGVRHLIYADNLQIYLTFPREELEDATRRMSNAANRVIDWANANRLKLKVATTKAIIFGSNVFVNDVYSLPDLSVNVGGSAVPFDTSVRSLGVVLDNKHSWKGHVAYVTQRVHSVMYHLRFLRASTTLGLRKHLIQALVFPLIDYCYLVYDGLSGVLVTMIQRLINMTVRYICGARRDDDITSYRLRLGWTTCEVRRKYFIACLTYKILRFGQPCDTEVIPPVTFDQLLEACGRFGNAKAPGMDGILNFALKVAINAAPGVSLSVCNACLQERVFPTTWTQLDIAGKILERILHQRIEEVVEP